MGASWWSGMATEPALLPSITASFDRSETASGTIVARSPRRNRRWSEVEDVIVRDAYPDYALMMRHLPGRSLSALKHRSSALGVVRRRHVWTQTEVRKLSGLIAAGACKAELLRTFSYLRPGQVQGKICHLGLRRRKAPLASFDDPAVSAVRKRAAEKGMSLRDLDRLARTGRYFQNSTRRLVLRHVARAVAVLGGEVRVEWGDS